MNAVLHSIFFRLQQVFWTFLTLLYLLKDRIVYGKRCFDVKEHPKPKCLEGWDDRVLQTKNVRLHYVQTGGDERPLLLMLHGFPEFWYSWRYQLNHFADKYRCIALDQRGYNLSEKPKNTEDYNIDYLIDDVREVVERLGYRKFFLMGHDWGAAIAWRFATVYPEFIDKLIILNMPYPSAFPRIVAANSDQMLKSWYMFMFQTPIIPELVLQSRDLHVLDEGFRGKGGIRNKQNFTDEDLEAYKHVFCQKDAFTGPVNYYRNIGKSAVKPGQDICKPPTLIIWGDQDQFLVKEGATISLEFCQNGQVKFIEGASHWVMQDEPEKVNKYVEEFLEMPNEKNKSEISSLKI